jgi:iron(III) transport system permease protein
MASVGEAAEFAGRERPASLLARLKLLGAAPVEALAMAAVALVVLWLVLYPVLWLLWGVFHAGAPGDARGWTLANLTTVLGDPEYWRMVLRSVAVAIGTTLFATLIGLPLAWLTVNTDMPGRRLVELAAILPFFTSTFIGALAWIFIANPTNGLLKLWFGLPVDVYSAAGIVWVTGLYMTPYMYLFAAAALRNIDTTYEEASFMCGAGLWRTLTRVTLPLITPALLSGMSVVLVLSMGIFGVAAILGFPARISLLATEVYVQANWTPPNYGAATVAGLTLMLITALCIGGQRVLLRGRSYTLVGGRGFRAKRYSLGRWAPAALAGCLLYAVLAVVLPLLVLIKLSFQVYPAPGFGHWTIANWTAFIDRPELLATLLRSLYLSVFGATFCVALTAVIAYIVQRSRLPGRKLLEQIGVMPMGIPGIVMGMAMVWAYITWPIWGTIWVIAIAYITLFMPYGVRAIGAGITQIHPELEESSRVHRGSWFRTFRLVLLPLLRPSLASTWILLFIIFIREISAAVMLTTIDSKLFPVLIFEQWMEGAFTVMCAGALLLSAIMLVVIAVFRWGFRIDVIPDYR